jgi:DNA-binding response OmpR family regulator
MTSRAGNLLIVDDDQATTQTFARMLMLEGHQVRTANTAEEGLREAETHQLDAIILDLRMPLINGLGFLYRLRSREHHRSTPVVVVTGDYFVDDETTDELRALGVEVRFKPLWFEELADLARALLSTRHASAAQPS